VLISDEYREINRRMHREKVEYGTNGQKRADEISDVMRSLSPKSILDYGCGKQTLSAMLGRHLRPGVEWVDYDPCIEGLDEAPRPADFVICTDVLEHIEPDCLDAVLDDIARLTLKAAYFWVATRSARKHLPDGGNAHLIIEPYTWWLPKLWKRQRLVWFRNQKGAFRATLVKDMSNG
jgi:hypothetical protein